MEDGSEGKLAADLRQMLADKGQPRLEEARQLALSDEQALKQILDGLLARDDAYRYNCFKVLYQVSEEQPHVLYSEWDYFIGLLDSDNSYHRSIGAQILANLTRSDKENRFESIFDRYFDLLDDDKIITARYVARHAGRIALNKPRLQAKIVRRLLDVDETHHQEGRKDLLKADVIESFEAFFDSAPDREEILTFIEKQLVCSSPKTRKAAKSFLKRHKTGRGLTS